MQKKKGAKKEEEKKTPFDLIIGKEVSVQLLRGTIIEGVFAGRHERFLMLTNAEVKGKKHICKTDLVFIHLNQIQHFHIKGEIREIEKSK